MRWSSCRSARRADDWLQDGSTLPPVVSFDVFETVLVPAVGNHEVLFFILGDKLWADGTSNYPPSQFASQRYWAYARAQERVHPGEPTIDQIYDELGVALGWSNSVVKHSMTAELALEERFIHAWLPGFKLLERARRSGSRVVFVSDTYLPQCFVERLLERAVGRRPAEPVLTSAAEATSKRDGGLFDRLCERMDARVSHVVHVGNSLVTDVARARERGITARYMHSANLNRYEEVLEHHSQSSGGLTSFLAGASRLTRPELSEIASARGYPIVTGDLVAGVLAPVVCGFVLWCLLQAERHDLNRLYFLAREGEPLLKMAKALCRDGSGPDLVYLHVSRQAINLSQFDATDPTGLDWLLTDWEMDTLPNLLARLGLTRADPQVIACLRQLSACSGGSADRFVNEYFVKSVKDDVHGLKQLVTLRAAERRLAVSAYLRGVGFFDDVAIGMVDVAGVGSQLRSLAKLRGSRSDSSDRGLLFNRYKPPRHHQMGGPVEVPIDAYYSDAVKGLGFRAHPYVAALLELACASNDGTVVGYKLDDSGAAIPQLGPAQEGASAELQCFVQEGLESFAAYVAFSGVPSSVIRGDVRPASSELMWRLWRRPARPEASALAAFKLEVGSGVVERLPLIVPKKLIDLLRRDRRDVEGRPWFYWHEGSMQMSSLPLRTLWKLKSWLLGRN